MNEEYVSPIAAFPENVRNRLYALMDEEEYSDNPRIAIVGNTKQEAAYDEIQQHGCCGSTDIIETIDGINYMIGFNYGH